MLARERRLADIAIAIEDKMATSSCFAVRPSAIVMQGLGGEGRAMPHRRTRSRDQGTTFTSPFYTIGLNNFLTLALALVSGV